MNLFNARPKDWEPSIRAFELQDARTTPPEKPILFVGSSSIRLWRLKKSFPGHPILNRGFGGSELSDALRYFDRIVLPYRPKAIVLYAGDNDLGRGKSAEEVVADYQEFAARVRSQIPKATLAILSIKPSPTLWSLWPTIQEVNRAVAKHANTDPAIHFLDTTALMLNDSGQARENFYLPDGLHMTPAGYDAWNTVVGPWLESINP